MKKNLIVLYLFLVWFISMPVYAAIDRDVESLRKLRAYAKQAMLSHQ